MKNGTRKEPASFRRKTLPLLLIPVIILASFGLSTYASGTQNLAIVAPYDTIATGQGNWGLNTAGFREFLTCGNQYRIRQDGTIKRVRLYVDSTDGLTGFYIRIWRKQTDGYSLVGSSEDIHGELSSGQINTIDLADPITNVQEGDYYGCRIEKSGNTSYSLCSKPPCGYDSPSTFYVDNVEPATEGFQWEAQAHDSVVVPVELYMDPPDYVFLGDSIISGYPLNNSFINGWGGTDIESTIERQFANLAHCSYQNMGLSGDIMSGISRRMEQDVVGLSPRVVVTEGGVNDLAKGPDITKDQLLGYWKNILDDAVSAGIDVVVIPILPCSDGSNDQMTIRDDWNKSLAKLVSEYQNADLADASEYVGKNRPGGPAGNLWDIQDECNADGLHFTPEGYRRIACAIYDKVQPPSIQKASFDEIPAGDTVTIVGTHFRPMRGASRVFFDGKETSGYVSWSDTEVRVRVPSELTLGTTRVTIGTLWGASEPFEFNLVPTITTISPTSKIVKQQAFTLTVNGTNFVAGSKVNFNGSPRTTTYVSATQLTATITAADIASAGTASVTVFNPTPGGGTSNAQTFTINNPVPTTTSLSPTSKTAGDAAFTLTVNGTNFVAGSIVRWNGTGRTTTYVSNIKLTAAIPASDITSVGTANVTVFNPTPGGGTSNIRTFTTNQRVFYFAEGTTRTNFQEYLCIFNPDDHDTTAKVTYLFTNGTTKDVSYIIPTNSRYTVNVNSVVGPNKDLSLKVLSSTPNLVVERPMYFDYNGLWTGGSDAVGATSPNTKWYFAEGNTLPGFDEYVTLLNPGASTANLTFHYMVAGQGEKDAVGSVGAHSRATFTTRSQIGPNLNASLYLSSSQAVVAERPMYFDYEGLASNNWTGGHDVVGTNSPNTNWYFAEGTTRKNSVDGAFEQWLCLQNPGTKPITVTATYQLATGQGNPISKSYTVPAQQRLTVSVNEEIGQDKDCSVYLHSASNFIAERPMYFNFQGVWTGGHDVVGFVPSQ